MLNDPTILKERIPGCEELSETDADQGDSEMKVGPVTDSERRLM
jgi:carbon monoxide dehydrogenase subunit G